MGTLRSASDCSGLIVNGITLGMPTFTNEIDPSVEVLFAWDDPRIPSGFIDNDGTIIIDEPEGI